jgi:hypothetical protein
MGHWGGAVYRRAEGLGRLFTGADTGKLVTKLEKRTGMSKE